MEEIVIREFQAGFGLRVLFVSLLGNPRPGRKNRPSAFCPLLVTHGVAWD
jgi:hypothetical protein